MDAFQSKAEDLLAGLWVDVRLAQLRVFLFSFAMFNICTISRLFRKGNGQRGGQFWCSVTHFSAPKPPKNGNFWKLFRKNGLSDTFLAPQAQNFFEKFRYSSEKSPNFVTVEDFIA